MSVNQKSHTHHEEAPLLIIADVAAQWNLTRQTAKGKAEWHGANPIDPNGATSDGFILFESGNAFDRKTNTKYTRSEVAQAATGRESGRNIPYNATRGTKTAKSTKPKFDWKREFDAYQYIDEGGKLLFEVLRQGHGDHKVISQRRPDARREATGEGGWVFKLDDVRRVLYRLPEVQKAEAVIIVEGEKCVDRLRAELSAMELLGGWAVTTNPHGAGKWSDEFSVTLKGKRVFIVPDNDEPGRKHALAIAASVVPVAEWVRVAELRDLPTKGGADDWLDKGNSVGTLIEELKKAPLWELPRDPSMAPPDADFSLDEIGNGKRFAAQHKDTLRYCSTREAWVIYDGGVWKLDERGGVEMRAKQTALAAVEEAKKVDEPKKRLRLYEHALTLCSRDKRSTMVKDAASEPGMMVTLSMFDENPFLFNCLNGTYDLEKFEFRPHSPEDYQSIQAPFLFDEKATSPTWKQCVDRWVPNKGTRQYLQDSVGATLSGRIFDEYFNLLYGEGGNGKSEFFRGIERMMGGYWHKTPAETLMMARDAKKDNAPAPQILALKGARLVTCHEIDQRHKLSANLVKDITGRDAITARGMFEKRMTTFTPQASLWLVGNAKPIVTDRSYGFWRRVRLIEFAETIRPEERDPLLEDKIRAELPGIFNWALEGLRRVMKHGLIVPDAINMATARYRAEQDPLSGFLNECCELHIEHTSVSGDVWKAWVCYCVDNSEEPNSPKWLTQELARQRVAAFKSGSERKYRGIRLKQSLPENAPQQSQVSHTVPNGTLGTQGTQEPTNSKRDKNTQKKVMGNHADSEPYGQQ